MSSAINITNSNYTDTTSTLNNATENAQGGRGGGLGDVGSTLGAVTKPGESGAAAPKKKGKKKTDDEEEEEDVGFGIEHKDVKGSLKVHIKLDLEADIRVIARIKGDIAIGLL